MHSPIPPWRGRPSRMHERERKTFHPRGHCSLQCALASAELLCARCTLSIYALTTAMQPALCQVLRNQKCVLPTTHTA